MSEHPAFPQYNLPQTFIGCADPYSEADTAIFGAPYDSTTSFRPGTRFAAQAMRPDSWGLETWSPYQDKDLDDYRICDMGDLELPFGQNEEALSLIEAQADALYVDGKQPVMIGGEHSVTLGAVRAAYKHHPRLRLIHFDAHTDLRDDYLGNPYSHASVIKRCWDILGDGRIHSFGIRSGLKEEFQWAKDHLDFHPFEVIGAADLPAEIPTGTPVYVTVDLDVLDPSVFPGTGTPEPGGVSFRELHEALISLRSLNVVGFDLVELSPHYDSSGVSTAVASKLLREMLLAFGKDRSPN